MRIHAALLLSLALLATALPLSAAERPVDWIVAIVDAEIITFTQFVEEMRIEAARSGQPLENLAPEQKNMLADRVMEKLVMDALLMQEARRRGISVTPAEIEEEAAQALERLRSQFVDQNTYERALAAEFTTPEKIRERYRSQAEAQILRTKLIDQEIRRKIRITDSEVIEAYQVRGDEVHVRHVLVGDTLTAENVRRRLAAGEDFDQVGGSVAALEVADLGWNRRGGLVEAFEKAAFALSPGQTSSVVRTRYGYHVIQLLERRKAELPALTVDLREKIFSEIYSSRFDSLIETYMQNLRDRAYTEVREEALSTLF